MRQPESPSQILTSLEREIRECLAGEGRGDPLDRVCLGIEESLEGALCTVMRLDPATGRLEVAAAPSAPPGFAMRFSAIFSGRCAGACGTSVILEEPVFVVDTTLDPRWAGFQEAVRVSGVRSSWSIPVRVNGPVLEGSFAINRLAPGAPGERELALLEIGATLVGLVFEKTAPRPTATSRGTVLLVDDNDMVRSVGRKIVEAAGYDTLLAGGGLEALEIFRDRGDGIGCVLLDYTMPEIGGIETARMLREIRPDVKIILLSGYNTESRVGEGAPEGFAGMLRKPFTARMISETLEPLM